MGGFAGAPPATEDSTTVQTDAAVSLYTVAVPPANSVNPYNNFE